MSEVFCHLPFVICLLSFADYKDTIFYLFCKRKDKNMLFSQKKAVPLQSQKQK